MFMQWKVWDSNVISKDYSKKQINKDKYPKSTVKIKKHKDPKINKEKYYIKFWVVTYKI